MKLAAVGTGAGHPPVLPLAVEPPEPLELPLPLDETAPPLLELLDETAPALLEPVDESAPVVEPPAVPLVLAPEPAALPPLPEVAPTLVRAGQRRGSWFSPTQ